jgi:PAS domain S-box-containing protein
MAKQHLFSSLRVTLLIVFLLMLVLMSFYELVKQYANPDLTIWESHTITIFFTSILSVIILYYPLRTAHIEQKNAEEAGEKLRRSEMQYRSFVESVDDSLYTVDLDLNYLLINSRHLARRGLAADTYFGKNYGDFHTDAETRAFAANVDEVVKTGGSVQSESEQNGRHYLRRLCPVIDPDENIVRAVTVISSDITDRRHIEKTLEDTNRKLSLVNEITRHDILNQLSVMNSCIALAGDRSTETEVKKHLVRLEQVADAIEAQISFARDYQAIGIESPQWQNLHSTILHARQPLRVLSIEIDPACAGIEIYADPLLQKVFYNLLQNSLKYGGTASAIRISCSIEEDCLFIVCEDNGPGIPPAEKEKIFARGYGKNTGLGLFLIREILSMTGITICETGEPGQGARFEISVPAGGFRQVSGS